MNIILTQLDEQRQKGHTLTQPDVVSIRFILPLIVTMREANFIKLFA